MTETTHLIRRDLPLEPGRKLAFVFTVAFGVTLDEDVLDYDGDGTREGEVGLKPASLSEIEKWMGGVHIDEEQLYRHLANNNDRNVIEHEVRLDDRYEGADAGPVRFETPWEAKEREQGKQDSWASRVWLDEVPKAGALPLGPESNPPVGEDPLMENLHEEFAKPISEDGTVRVSVVDLEGKELAEVDAQDVKLTPGGMEFTVAADDEDAIAPEVQNYRDRVDAFTHGYKDVEEGRP